MKRKSETMLVLALVRLDRDGVFIEPGETIELPAATATVLLARGLVDVAPVTAVEVK